MACSVQKKWQTLKAAGYTIVAIDQHTQVVKTKQTHGWFPVNSRPRLAVSGGRKALNLLGAVTENGDRFITVVTGRLTGDVAKYFLRALQQEFGKKLAVVLDNAPYFIEKSFKKQAAGDGLLLEYLPPYSPELNPLEQCWRQLQAGRANRLFRSLPELNAYLVDALPTLVSPKIYEYLC
ncbi:IS630 family transposase [Natronococcus wangiae]|uniref:IS630 family transposase n=1 Tax=Natronococcus wangiae TaxID=3068275 RepID=UPI002740114E|nr:IS630 family transposase [Natronococcus sp. AD5]